MLTNLMNDKGMPTYSYRAVNDKISRLQMNNPDGWFTVHVGNHILDIRKSLVYISGNCLRNNYEVELGKMFPPDKALSLVDRFSGPSVLSEKKRVYSNNKRLNEIMDDIECAAGLTDSLTLMTYHAESALYPSRGATTEMFIVGILIAISMVHGKYIDIPNIYNAHALLCYYWFRGNGCLDNDVMKAIMRDRKAKSAIGHASVDLECLEAMIKVNTHTNSSVDTYINYLIDFNVNGANRSKLNAIDSFKNEVREVRKSNQFVKDAVGVMYKFLSSDPNGDLGKKLLGKKSITSHAEILTSTTIYISGFKSSMFISLPLIYEALKYIDLVNGAKNDRDRDVKLAELDNSVRAMNILEVLNHYSWHIKIGLWLSVLKLTVSSIKTSANDSIKLSSQIESVNKSYDVLKNRYNKLKDGDIELNNKLKQCEKELKFAQDEVARLKDLINKGGVSVSDINKLKSEIIEITEERDNAKNKVLEQQESLIERDRMLKKQSYSLKKLQGELANKDALNIELEEKLKSREETIGNLQVATSFNNIPIECFVNSIKDKNIAFVGGNMDHYKLKELGLNNIKFFESGDRGINTKQLGSIELLVVVTSLVGHPASISAISAAKRLGVPIIQGDTKNVTLIVHEIFKKFYS